jgi:hypothetical protein
MVVLRFILVTLPPMILTIPARLRLFKICK